MKNAGLGGGCDGNDGSDGGPIQIKWTVGGNTGNALAFDEETGNFVVYDAPRVAVDLIEYHSDGTFSVYGWSPARRCWVVRPTRDGESAEAKDSCNNHCTVLYCAKLKKSRCYC